MIFEPLALQGAYLIYLQKLTDERGFFARSWCQREFTDHGLDANIAQCNVSFNRLSSTLRGMHYQVVPFAETKLVRCTRGSVFDVIIDLRLNSPTFLQWTGATLTPDNGQMMYVPKGFAHGFETLEENSEVSYLMSEFYAPDCPRGVRWDDPLFSITWPLPVTTLSDKDGAYPDSTPEQFTDLGETLV